MRRQLSEPRATTTPAPGMAAAPKEKKPPSLAEENAILRRENAEVRQQLLQLMASASPPALDRGSGSGSGGSGGSCSSTGGVGAGSAQAASFWLDAQLRHARRQVQMLSDALVLKVEITADLEAVIMQLRALEHGPPTQWCREALRRIRSVQFAEELAGELQAAAGKGGASLAGPGAPSAAPPRRAPAAGGGISRSVASASVGARSSAVARAAQASAGRLAARPPQDRAGGPVGMLAGARAAAGGAAPGAGGASRTAPRRTPSTF
jgi:hypothetical protein